MKKITAIIFFLTVSLSSFSQNFWAINYGEYYSFGVDVYQNNSKVHFINDDSFDPIDTIQSHNYTSFLPHIKLHYDIASITEKDIIYFNFVYGISINLGYRIDGERSTDNFPVAHFAETGLTYLYGDEYGKAYLGTVSLTFLPAFNTGELFLGPTLSVGYQFEWDERLFQVYAKGGLGLLGRINKSDNVTIDGYSYEANSSYNSQIFGIGVLYRGLN